MNKYCQTVLARIWPEKITLFETRPNKMNHRNDMSYNHFEHFSSGSSSVVERQLPNHRLISTDSCVFDLNRNMLHPRELIPKSHHELTLRSYTSDTLRVCVFSTI